MKFISALLQNESAKGETELEGFNLILFFRITGETYTLKFTIKAVAKLALSSFYLANISIIIISWSKPHPVADFRNSPWHLFSRD